MLAEATSICRHGAQRDLAEITRIEITQSNAIAEPRIGKPAGEEVLFTGLDDIANAQGISIYHALTLPEVKVSAHNFQSDDT